MLTLLIQVIMNTVKSILSVAAICILTGCGQERPVQGNNDIVIVCTDRDAYQALSM